MLFNRTYYIVGYDFNLPINKYMITLADEFIASKRCEITINCSINGVVGQFSNNASLLLDDSLCMYISKDDTFS